MALLKTSDALSVGTGQVWRTFIPPTLIIALILFASSVHSQQKHQSQNRSRPKSVTAKTADAKWYTFTGPDNDFNIHFPTKPTRAEDVQGPVTILRRYVSSIDTTYFEISIQDFGGEPDSPEANSYGPKFEQNLSQMLKEDGFRIMQIRRTTKKTYEMEAWTPSLTPGKYLHSLARGLLHKGRQYRMGCNSLVIGEEVDRRVCRRFFNSFRIIGVPNN
jgi:hypothetical protein